MRTYLILICVLFITSCAPKYPLKMNIDDYQKGLEITNSVISTENLFKDKCIKLDSNIPAIQMLKRQKDDETLYTFENEDLLKNYQLSNNCNSDNLIKVTNIRSKYSWYGRMRLNIYTGNVSLESTYYCNSKTTTFTSIKESQLKKHGKLITFGDIGEEKNQAMIAAVIVLAFDKAISDIYDQVKSKCK
jgi:hypothetical protein